MYVQNKHFAANSLVYHSHLPPSLQDVIIVSGSVHILCVGPASSVIASNDMGTSFHLK
jgi:hypothetical protein